MSKGLEQSISFPYQTIKRTVIFGGHHTFLKEIRKKLPNVKYVNISDYAFNVDIIRNADVVWVQTNCISHTQYARILKTVRTYGTQLCYFPALPQGNAPCRSWKKISIERAYYLLPYRVYVEGKQAKG